MGGMILLTNLRAGVTRPLAFPAHHEEGHTTKHKGPPQAPQGLAPHLFIPTFSCLASEFLGLLKYMATTPTRDVCRHVLGNGNILWVRDTTPAASCSHRRKGQACLCPVNTNPDGTQQGAGEGGTGGGTGSLSMACMELGILFRWDWVHSPYQTGQRRQQRPGPCGSGRGALTPGICERGSISWTEGDTKHRNKNVLGP